MKRLLVTGVSGLLGWNLCRTSPCREWEVYGVFFTHEVNIQGITTLGADLRDEKTVENLFQEIRPDAVIHAAAISDTDSCQTRFAESYPVNVETPARLASICRRRSVPLLFTSSDLVFDGLNPPYREGDPVCPVSSYGEQKTDAEKRILSIYPDAAICRLPLMIGIPGPGSRSLLPMLSAMRARRPLRLFTDEYRTPLTAKAAAEGLFLVLEKGTGIIHVGGPERISRYDLGRLIAEIFEEREAVFAPCRQKDVITPEPRPPDVSLDSSRAFELGFRPMPLAEQIRALYSEFRSMKEEKG